METLTRKCIILLSSKSAGSSALQNLATRLPDVHHVEKTEHRENETLYWTKAASILGMPQYDMLDSEVPITAEKSKKQLVQFLQANLPAYVPPADNDELIFGGWKMLCDKYAPVFFEKSPHHLHQWSALELINDCIRRFPDIDFLIVGLVRNPMDTIYSRWSGGRSYPEKYQYEWLKAYRNLLKFKECVRCDLVLVRYEDMVRDVNSLAAVYRFAGCPEMPPDEGYLHGRSVAKWKKDRHFGFQMADEVMALGESFGYSRADMTNTGKRTWQAQKYLLKFARTISTPVRRLRQLFRKMIRSRA